MAARAPWRPRPDPASECFLSHLKSLRSRECCSQAVCTQLGPASDFGRHFGGEGFEVEVVSLAGECKEATVWFGAAATCRRRASRLPGGATWTDRDGDAGARAPVVPAGGWVF